jgi:glycosyltransferase involved in cell wall biosynthesis
MRQVLAIAAPSFAAPSETFIRDHVRMFAPSETILICQDRRGADELGRPVIEVNSRRPPRSLGEHAARAVRRGWQRYIDPRLRPADGRRLLDFFAVHQPKALLAEYGPTGCLLSDACAKARVPLYVHFHGHDANVLPQRRFVRARYKRLFETASAVIATSQFLKRRLLQLGCPEEKLRVCPCGIDTDLFARRAPKSVRKTVLMVSRLVAQKGPIYSLRSFARTIERHPDALLEVIGDGPLRSDLEREVESLGLSGSVHFHGAQPHDFVRSRLQAAHLLIQHCVTTSGGGVESLGLSLLEAMACELAVVATRHGAIPETVEEGVTGLLVDEYDVEGMADAMARLLSDPERAAAMGVAGRRRVVAHYPHEKARQRLRTILGFAP